MPPRFCLKGPARLGFGRPLLKGHKLKDVTHESETIDVPRCIRHDGRSP